MQLEAFAPALWAATLRTLRKLTRLAVTALVLVVGVGGVASAFTVDALQPVAAREFRSVGSPVATVPDRHAVAGSVATAAAVPVTERVTATEDPPASGIRTARPDRHTAGLRPSARTVVAPADPGRDAVARRGPPLV